MNRLILIICSLIFIQCLLAQDPVHWNFSVKKISEEKYELHLTATVQEAWHTYSQSTPDGGPLPTKFTFTQNPLVKPEGNVRELGQLKVIHDNTFDVDVKYFPGNVDFVMLVDKKAKVKTRVSGTIEYMACNDRQCLPPKTVPFTIELP